MTMDDCFFNLTYRRSGMYFKWAIAVLSLIVSTQLAAQPNSYLVHFFCPATSGSIDVLTNYGSYVAGDGRQFFDGDDYMTPAFFKGPVTSDSNVPANVSLGGYTSSGTSYVEATGMITCFYISSLGFDPIKVSYTMINGHGGIVTSSANSSISIYLSRGVKS